MRFTDQGRKCRFFLTLFFDTRVNATKDTEENRHYEDEERGKDGHCITGVQDTLYATWKLFVRPPSTGQWRNTTVKTVIRFVRPPFVKQ